MAASMGSFLLAAGTKGKRHWAISHGKTVGKLWETLMNIHEECPSFG